MLKQSIRHCDDHVWIGKRNVTSIDRNGEF